MFALKLIPKAPDTRPTIFDVALNNAWIYLEMVEADPSDMLPTEHIFQPEGTEVTVHFVDDFVTEVKYYILKGEHPAELEVVAGEIREAMPLYGMDEILSLFASATTPDEQIQAVSMAGIVAPGAYQALFFGVFRDALSASHPGVRLAAIRSTAYAGWPELEPLLAECSSRDPDESVRSDAAIMRQALLGVC